MTREKRVLFLSAYVGTGHMSAAEAVKKALLEINPHIKALVVDAYTYAGPLLAKVASQGYIQLVKFFPRIYSFLYALPHKSPNLSRFKSRLAKKVIRSFKTLILEYRPDVLVCTHAFPSGIAALLKEEFSIPTVSVITDFTVHPFWINRDTDLYLVGSAELRASLEEQGISADRIRVTGIPVDPRFSLRGDKPKLRKALGLDPDLKTILLMGGGAGLGPISKLFRHLKNVSHPIQVLVVTGVNRSLRAKMERMSRKLASKRGTSAIRNVRVYAYVENVYELMNAADLLISKPGGLTSSEALAAELPIAIVRPLPGQEVRNAQYLSREHAAVVVKREKDISKIVDELLEHPEELSALKERARALKKPKAAHEAAHAILELLAHPVVFEPL